MKTYRCPTCKSRLGLAIEEYDYLVNLTQSENALAQEQEAPSSGNAAQPERQVLRRAYQEDMYQALLLYKSMGATLPSDIDWWLTQIETLTAP